MKAIIAAKNNVAPGLIFYSEDIAALEASIVLAPDIPLKKALGMVLVIQMGLADSLGALAPPELAVHFNWPNAIKVNGAFCGETFYQASLKDENTIPEWLVIGFKIPFLWDKEIEAGENPNKTVLSNEGCIEMTPYSLLESWSRHSLVWLNRFLDEGLSPVHRAWCEKCDNIGETLTIPLSGRNMGLDEDGNMIIRTTKKTLIKKLVDYMET
jgi:biotin-(acetyl-CoA carboxylase) ligase